MKKALILLVVTISILLIAGAVAESQGQGKAKRGLQARHGKTIKAQLKNVTREFNCSAENQTRRGLCREKRQRKIKEMVGNCTEDNQTIKECIVEAKRERWERRVEGLKDKCAGNDTSACRRRLNAVKECLDRPSGPDRAECARNKLNLGRVVSQLKGCRNQTNQTECIQDLKDKVYEYATVKLQDLADRAENLLELGVNASIVDDFVAFVEDSIIAFEEAETVPEKKDVILGVRKAWLTLIQEAKKAIAK